jgi:hypothetical protein
MKDQAEPLAPEIFYGPRLGKELVMSDPGFGLETDAGPAQQGTSGLRDRLESPGENYLTFKNVDGQP